jgi:hypothetical protein
MPSARYSHLPDNGFPLAKKAKAGLAHPSVLTASETNDHWAEQNSVLSTV